MHTAGKTKGKGNGKRRHGGIPAPIPEFIELMRFILVPVGEKAGKAASESAPGGAAGGPPAAWP
jgi:hypothetical protein